ncbi:PIN domain nuclease [Endozoicomonas sp.]|nr:PIN domain nuclease [Endozoicomonas sp.]
MILADTSVWIDYLNGKITPASDLLDACLVEGTLAMGDLIFLEILQGIRDNKQFRQVKNKLSLLDEYTLFSPSMVIKCANNFRALRKKGITVRKTNDVIIASFCIEQKMALLYTDRDFNPFSDHLGLKSALP